MLLSAIPKIPFSDQLSPEIKFKDNSKRSIKPFERLIKDTKSYVFTPLEDEFEKASQDNVRQIESSYTGDVEEIYSQIQALRQTERKEMISKGYLDDENSKRSLDNAIAFRGTCREMCPPFERLKRTRQNNVNINEKNPVTNKIDPDRAVKSFARPAAGQEPPLPSDVRPPKVLVSTLSYLVDNLLDKMPETQSFIWDRTRSIRQDFTFQNYFGPETIDCNEKIARIHIYSLHIMAANPHIEYSQQQEMEQLEKSLKTLCDMYTEYRNKGFPQPPNEAEFRAYFLVLKFQDTDLERITESLPAHIFEDSRIQWALYVRRCVSTKKLKNSLQVYTTFFNIIINSPDFPFLLSCLLETKFNEIRLHAIKAIFKSVHSKYKNLTLQHLVDALNFQSKEKLKEYLNFYSITYIYNSDNGEETIDMKSIPKFFNKLANDEDRKIMKSDHDSRLDFKIGGMSKSDIINNGYPNDFTINENSTNKDSFDSKSGFSSIQKQSQVQENHLKIIEQNERQESLRRSILQKQESIRKSREQQAEKQKYEEMTKQKELEKQRELEQQKARKEKEAARKLRKEELKLKEIESRRRQEEMERIRFLEQQELEKQRLQKLKEAEQKRKSKELAINKLSSQLFKGFLDEIVYLTILKSMADNFRAKTLKQFAIKRLLQTSKKVQDNVQKRKLERYEASRTLKSLGVDANIDYHSKRACILNDHLEKDYRETAQKPKSFAEADSSFGNMQNQMKINKRNNGNNDIWKPLDLSIFCDICAQNTNSKVEKINCLMYAENWRSGSGKWLANKFSLIPNNEFLTYGNSVKNNKLLVNFVAITKRLNESFLKDTGFIIFECGFTSKEISSSNYKEKLKRDGNKLFELSNELSKRSDYKFQIVLLYWANVKISELEVYDCLNIDRIKSSLKTNLYDIVFCSLKSSITADYQLQKSLRKIGKHFKGLKSTKLIKCEEDNKPCISTAQNDVSLTADTQRKSDTPEIGPQKHDYDVSEKREEAKRAIENEKSLVENHPYFRKYMSGNNSLYWNPGMRPHNTMNSSLIMQSSSGKSRRILPDGSFHSLRGNL